MKKLKAPFPWFGGKSRVAHLVWERFGDVPNYLEPFAGSLAVLLGRPTKARAETVNDKDRYLVNFWRAIQHAPEVVAHYADWPVNEVDVRARHDWLVTCGRQRLARLDDDPEDYDPKIAGWWVWGVSSWLAGGWCPEEKTARGFLKDADMGGVRRKVPHLTGAGQGVNGAGGVIRNKPCLGGSMGVQRKLGDEHRAALVEWFQQLATRLRRVRVLCGDWRRTVTPAVCFAMGGAGILLDPPYVSAKRDRVYATDSFDIGHQVREWAIENGEHPELRIALCGYEGEHDMPAGWDCVAWKASGGYGNRTHKQGRENAKRERIWFSPACARAQRTLF
jgi:site-specific DNA-adenine methylase